MTDGTEEWEMDNRAFDILALREDWEINHYSMYSKATESAEEETRDTQATFVARDWANTT